MKGKCKKCKRYKELSFCRQCRNMFCWSCKHTHRHRYYVYFLLLIISIISLPSSEAAVDTNVVACASYDSDFSDETGNHTIKPWGYGGDVEIVTNSSAKYGGSAYIKSGTSYLNWSNAMLNTTNDIGYTICMWMYPTQEYGSDGARLNLFGRYGSVAAPVYLNLKDSFDPVDKSQILVGNNAGQTNIINENLGIKAGEWKHYCLAIGFQTGLKSYHFYINGTEVYSGTTGQAQVDTPTLDLLGGARTGFGNGFCTGCIFDEVIIYNENKTESDIMQIYQNQLCPTFTITPNLGYFVNITSFTETHDNDTVNFLWNVTTNSTVANLTLYYINETPIYSTTNLGIIAGGGYNLSGLINDTSYSFYINVTHNSTVFNTSSLSLTTGSNSVPIDVQQLQKLISIDIHLDKIEDDVSMIAIAILYIGLMFFGLTAMKYGQYFTGILSWMMSVIFDFLLIALLQVRYLVFTAGDLNAMWIYLFGLGLIMWIFLKLMMFFSLRTKRILT